MACRNLKFHFGTFKSLGSHIKIMFSVIPQAILNFQKYKKRSKARRKLMLYLIALAVIASGDSFSCEDHVCDQDFSINEEIITPNRTGNSSDSADQTLCC